MLGCRQATALARANGLTASDILEHAVDTANPPPGFLAFCAGRIDAERHDGDVGRPAMGTAGAGHVLAHPRRRGRRHRPPGRRRGAVPAGEGRRRRRGQLLRPRGPHGQARMGPRRQERRHPGPERPGLRRRRMPCHPNGAMCDTADQARLSPSPTPPRRFHAEQRRASPRRSG
ncbi:hypothetical protein ACFQ0Y_33210 [Streptomyces globosus]